MALAFASVLMMGGQKWGRWSPMSFDRSPDPGFARVRLYFEPVMNGTLGPTTSHMRAHLNATPLSVDDFVNTTREDRGVQNLYLGPHYADGSGTNPYPALEAVNDTWIRPVVFGYAIGQTTLDARVRQPASQVFTNQPWTAERVGPLWRFGIVETPVESGVYLYDRSSFLAGAAK